MNGQLLREAKLGISRQKMRGGRVREREKERITCSKISCVLKRSLKREKKIKKQN